MAEILQVSILILEDKGGGWTKVAILEEDREQMITMGLKDCHFVSIIWQKGSEQERNTEGVTKEWKGRGGGKGQINEDRRKKRLESARDERKQTLELVRQLLVATLEVNKNRRENREVPIKVNRCRTVELQSYLDEQWRLYRQTLPCANERTQRQRRNEWVREHYYTHRRQFDEGRYLARPWKRLGERNDKWEQKKHEEKRKGGRKDGRVRDNCRRKEVIEIEIQPDEKVRAGARNSMDESDPEVRE